MMTPIKTAAAVLFLTLVFFHSQSEAQAPAVAKPLSAADVKTEKYLRTELYLGRAKPDGTLISDEDWRSFLAETVTPLFPDGITVIASFGQYREKSGKIISEPSQVLIFLYPANSKKQSRAKLEEVRTAYIRRFSQESVLRVDLPKAVRVAF